MAATTRALTPTHTGPFAAPNRPTTPGAAARNAHGGATFGTHLTNSPGGLSPRPSPQTVPAAMSLSDERQYRKSTSRQASPNTAAPAPQSAIPASALPGPPPTNGQPHKMQKPAIIIPEQSGVTGEAMQTSPVSLSSFGDDATSAAAAGAPEATAGSKSNATQDGAPPQPHHHHQHHHQLIAPNPGDNPGNRAFTFPGPMPPEPDPRAPARQMSLPGYGQNTPKSPSTKRHKCPYCSTDFTRHHNLKSHLLTHSQEKPYECPTCQARFRRLHDLKRHTKLHTGERPHTCFKCGRRFARADALARHNKGQGGCAGRRSSFGMDDDLADAKGDGDMDGVVYTGEHDGDGDEDEDGPRRVSEPARKRQNTGNSTQAPASISSLHHANQPNVFAHGGMTESPKPLSPGQQEQHRLGARDNSLPGSRSPNMSHHIHQQSLARAANRGTPPMALAPPATNNGPHLPPLPGLNPMGAKQGSQGAKGSMLQHQPMAAPGSSSQPGSMSSQGGSGSSMRELMGNQVDVWQYVRDMEARMARTEKEHTERIALLTNEVTTLRNQLSHQNSNPAHGQQVATNTQAQQPGA